MIPDSHLSVCLPAEIYSSIKTIMLDDHLITFNQLMLELSGIKIPWVDTWKPQYCVMNMDPNKNKSYKSSNSCLPRNYHQGFC